MPFTESIRLEAKRRSHFQCCICKEPFVQVHHIVPEAAGGVSEIHNAAPLCASCHDRFGGNPDKRKQIREMRDLWWEICAERAISTEMLAFNERLDQIQDGLLRSERSQADDSKTLQELKDAFSSFARRSADSVACASSLPQFQKASGIALPKAMTNLAFSLLCPRCSSSDTQLLAWTDGYLGEVRVCSDCGEQFHVTQAY